MMPTPTTVAKMALSHNYAEDYQANDEVGAKKFHEKACKCSTLMLSKVFTKIQPLFTFLGVTSEL